MRATGQRRGPTLDGSRSGHWGLVIAVGMMALLWPASRTDAGLLDLNGEATLDYRLTNVESDGESSQNSSLQEIVTLGTNGAIFREVLGRYQLNFSFINDDRTGDQQTTTQTFNYFGSLTLFPLVMPLSLSAQRLTQEVESNTTSTPVSSGKITTSTYSLAWDAPRIWKLPQLHLNVYYTTLETNSCTAVSPPSCDDTTRVFGGSLNATDQYPYRYLIKNTVLTWTLSFSSVQQFSGRTGLSVGGRMTADSQWTPDIKSNARVSYTTGLSRQTPSVPGQVANVTSAGFTVFYRPSLKLNSNVTYDFTKDTFDRHVGGVDIFYRPSPQFDITVASRGSYLDFSQSKVIAGYGSALVLYRPILNLNASLSGTLGVTDTTSNASADTSTVYQNYGAFVTYFKLYELVRISTSGGLAVNNTFGTNASQTNLNGSWSAQATNTKTQYVTLTGNYAGNYNQQFGSGGTDQLSNAIRADATSSYFRELLLRGDVLTLHAGAADTTTTGGTYNVQTVDLRADLQYGWQGVGVGGGYATHISSQTAEDYNTYFTNLHWTVPPLLQNLDIMVNGRYEQRLMNEHTQADQTTATADVNGAYHVGLVQFSLQYQFKYFDLSSSTLSHNIFVRVTRRFSL
jgi:hypothetical protein